MSLRRLVTSTFVVVVALAPALAGAKPLSLSFKPKAEVPAPLDLTLAPSPADDAAPPQTAAPAPAFAYSDGYRLRAKIHKISSLTMLPLLGAQGLVGISLYDSPTPAKRSWHQGLAWGVGGLFAVNTLTGVTNLIEARKDPNGRTLRVVHAALMLAADAGFLATAMTAPEGHEGNYATRRSTHRAIAFTSAGTATLGYLLMLFGHK